MAVRLTCLFVFIVGITCVSLAFYLLGPPSIPGTSWNKQWIQLNHHESLKPDVTSDRWIVVTTASHPTQAIKFLAKIPGWRLVVVGDTETPKDWSWQNCVYLSPSDQQGLGFETVGDLPVQSYARKTVGYLFAVSHGAKVIYETDDDSKPLDLLTNFVLEKEMWGLSYSGKGFFNPYRHFGQLTLWPRVYPLSAVGESDSANYQLNHYKTPSVQHGVVNGDLNMDAIFRLTRKQTISAQNVTFDRRAPPAIVPSGVFSPFICHNTLFRYDALWALFIPSTAKYCVCDVWRGFWAQRLLWEIRGNVGFFSSMDFQKGNSHSHILDNIDEKDLHLQAKRLVTFLSEWKCKPEKSFFECMIQLSTDMVNNNFWKERDKLMAQNWVRHLTSSGYREPKRIPFGSLMQGVEIVERKSLPDESNASFQISNVTFYPVEETPSSKSSRGESAAMVSNKTQLASFCTNITRTSHVGSVKLIQNILLIIVFNFPFYDNIPLLEAMYKMHIPHIIYCGENKHMFDERAQKGKPVSFIEVNVNRGWFGQNCLTQAMKMNYNVDGYLYIGDDTLLNVWNLHKLPLDKLWLTTGIILQQSVKTKWTWFNRPDVGLKRYQAAIQASRHLNRDKFDKFFSRLANNSGHKDGLYIATSDIAFVPRRFREDVLYFLEHFSKFNLFLEISIPTVFAGIDLWDNVYQLPGMYLRYDGKRDHFEKYFNSSHVFMHPVKMSNVLETPKGKSFLCGTFVPLIFKDG